MEIIYHTQTIRKRAQSDLAALILTYSLVHFTENDTDCETLNRTISDLTNALCDYVKEDLLKSVSLQYTVRYPVTANITPTVHRMDHRLLSLELAVLAKIKQQTVYQKHIYLHLGENGTLPLSPRQIAKKAPSCVYVVDNEAIDPSTGYRYEIRKKYQKEK